MEKTHSIHSLIFVCVCAHACRCVRTCIHIHTQIQIHLDVHMCMTPPSAFLCRTNSFYIQEIVICIVYFVFEVYVFRVYTNLVEFLKQNSRASYKEPCVESEMTQEIQKGAHIKHTALSIEKTENTQEILIDNTH